MSFVDQVKQHCLDAKVLTPMPYEVIGVDPVKHTPCVSIRNLTALTNFNVSTQHGNEVATDAVV